MSSPPRRPSLTRARPLTQTSIATRTSTIASSRAGDQSVSSERDLKISTTLRDDDTGYPLTSIKSVPNRETWRLKPTLERSTHRFTVMNSFEAEIYKNASPSVPKETYHDRRRMRIVSAISAEYHEYGHAGHHGTSHCGTSHRSSSAKESQSALNPTKDVGAGQSVSTSNSVGGRGGSGNNKYEAGDYPDALPDLLIASVNGNRKAQHDLGHLAKAYLV